MRVQRPKHDKTVCFVRLDGKGLLWTLATLYRDDSCGFCYPEREPLPDGSFEWTQLSCNPAPDNWEVAIAMLAALGFIELQVAQAAGWVPDDWLPPSSLDTCGRLSLSGQDKDAEPGVV